MAKKLAAVLIVLALLLVGGAASFPATADASSQAQGFNVLNVSWGTSTTTSYPGPGDQNVPLTVTLQYYYANTAADISAFLTLPPGFVGPNGNSNAATYVSGTVSSGSEVQFTFYVDIAPSAAIGSYSIPLAISWVAELSSTNSVSLIQYTQAVVDLGGRPSLQAIAPQTPLEPGQVNQLSLVVANRGSGPAYNVSIHATGQTLGILGPLPTIGTLQPGAEDTLGVKVYAPTSLEGLPTTLTFAFTYIDPYGYNQSATQTLDTYVSATPATQTNESLSISAQQNGLRVGTSSPVSFTVTNTGSYPLYSPRFSLSLSSPLIATANSSYSMPGRTIEPGKGVVYEAVLVSDPSASPNYYSGTLTVSYLDQFGNAGSQVLPVSFTLEGTILMVVQNPQVTQTQADLTVSGSILNEGFSSAYYASVTGSVGNGPQGAPYYVGEVDPNTPVPFSVTIPYVATNAPNQTAKVSVEVSYRDSLGNPQAYSSEVPASLKTASQLLLGQNPAAAQASSGDGAVAYVEYGVVGVLVAIAVVGAFLVRRARPRARAADDERVI